MVESVPTCLVIAGPNGAGKSTLYKRLQPFGQFINADMIAAEMNPDDPEGMAFSAGREAIRRIEANLYTRESFAFETTLSGQQPLKMIKLAKERGYLVMLIFVALSSAELHISRVAQRVSLGGHNISSSIIRRRYVTSFEQLTVVAPSADETAVYDNSAEQGFRLCISIEGGRVVENHLSRSRSFDRRIAKCLESAFDWPTGHLC